MNPIKNGIITSGFDDPRPLSNPGQHVHGAIDISPNGDNNIYAPFDCTAWGYMAVRHPSHLDKYGREKNPQYWPESPVIHGKTHQWCNYFYDMYGGVIFLEEKKNKKIINTHLICHSWGNQIFNKSRFDLGAKYYLEEKEVKRFPIFCWYTGKLSFSKGDIIGSVGSAGYSTGKHIHWEIHPGTTKVKYADRIRPTNYL